MKNLILIFLTIILSTSVYSQKRYGRGFGLTNVNWFKQGWFMDGNIGMRYLGKTSNASDMSPGFSSNGNIGYFFNEKFGLKGRMDYQTYKVFPGYNNTVSNKLFSVSLSAEAIMRLEQMFGYKRARDYAFNLHMGLGITSLFNPDYRKYYTEVLGKKFDDPFIKGADDMFHIVYGINPQYHISSQFSLNFDLSHFIQFKQYKTYDTFSGRRAGFVTGVVGITLGATFRFN